MKRLIFATMILMSIVSCKRTTDNLYSSQETSKVSQTSLSAHPPRAGAFGPLQHESNYATNSAYDDLIDSMVASSAFRDLTRDYLIEYGELLKVQNTQKWVDDNSIFNDSLSAMESRNDTTNLPTFYAQYDINFDTLMDRRMKIFNTWWDMYDLFPSLWSVDTADMPGVLSEAMYRGASSLTGVWTDINHEVLESGAYHTDWTWAQVINCAGNALGIGSITALGLKAWATKQLTKEVIGKLTKAVATFVAEKCSWIGAAIMLGTFLLCISDM